MFHGFTAIAVEVRVMSNKTAVRRIKSIVVNRSYVAALRSVSGEAKRGC
jgi:hypothetical protein